MDVVVEQRIDVLYPDGQLVPVTVRLGRPVPHPKCDWACSVQAEGLRIWQGPTDLFGVGPIHALMIGAKFLHNMLSIEIERGAVPHYEGSAEPMSIDALFVFTSRESDE